MNGLVISKETVVSVVASAGFHNWALEVLGDRVILGVD